MPSEATSEQPLQRVRAATAAEVARLADLSGPAQTLLTVDLSPADYWDALLQNGLVVDAARFLAYALPKTEGVWWACRCARTVFGKTLAPERKAALEAAEKWVAIPSEENRRKSQQAAEAAKFDNPAGCAAMGAYWSSGSLSPPGSPTVPPPPQLTAQAVFGAVALAAALGDPVTTTDRFRQLLQIGHAVASGKDRWPT